MTHADTAMPCCGRIVHLTVTPGFQQETYYKHCYTCQADWRITRQGDTITWHMTTPSN